MPAFTGVNNIKKLNVNEQKFVDIKEIKINGINLPSFSSTNSVYRVNEKLTKESISFVSDYIVTVEEFDGSIKLTASDPNNILRSRSYYINYQEKH